MATALEKTGPTAKFGTEVDEQIAQATSRIRAHDLVFGSLLLAAMVLVYATVMILLDRYLVIPDAVRQLALLAFLAASAATAYLAIVRPLRRRLNPLYAAARVEKTIENPKNSVLGYVEAQEKGDVHPAVRAAMGARAAKTVGKADINRAVDHRSLAYTGAVVVAFLLALVVLFFLFRPTQFASLVSRTFTPFSSGEIATRTQLTLAEPQGGDVTITTGQSVTIKVQVGGKVPDPEKPDRVRVLVRHDPTAPNYEEIPLEKGESSRDWQVRVPDYLVRNGFWYKVAGGDAETQEYKVTVRSLPIFTQFDVTYEYPAYTRRPPETVKDPYLKGYRGTKVTVVGKTNRTVKDGRLVFEPPARGPVAGKVVPGKPDSLEFQFLLTEAGSYRVHFTSAEGERNSETLPYSIKIDSDQAPTVEIVKPEDDVISVPANGQLAVDGRIGDDLGIDKVTLKMKLEGPGERLLADKPYEGGKSFRRASDDTWPKSLEYKDSVDFTQLTDAGGQKVELKEGMTLAYWLEAADNQTKPGPNGPEPDPNVGRSKVKRVQVTPPKVEPVQREKLDEQKQQRKSEEANHNKAQQRKLETENRDPNQQPNNAGENPPPMKGEQRPDNKTEPKKEEGAGQADRPKTGNKDTADPNTPNETPTDKGGTGTPMPKGGNDNKNPNDPGMKGAENQDGSTTQPQTAPMPADRDRNQVQKQANDVQNKLEEERSSGGPGKGNNAANNEERTQAGDAKQQPPMDGGKEPDSQPKGGPKPDSGMNAGAGASEEKSAGNVEKPEDPAAPKPEPKANANPTQPRDGSQKPSESKEQPPGGAAGSDKETPRPKNEGSTQPMPSAENPGGAKNEQPQPAQDPSGGGSAKPATQQQPAGGNDSDPMNTPNGMGQNTGSEGTQPKNPTSKSARSKPMPNNDRGDDKDTGPKGGNSTENQSEEGGVGKPQTAPEPSATKPTPKGDNTPMPNGGDTSDSKPAPADAGMGEPMTGKPRAGETKPEGQNPPANGATAKSTPQGEDKQPPGQKQAGGPKGGGGNDSKIDPEKRKGIEQAAQDLASNDPKRQQAARDKLDKMVGPENRKQAEQLLNDLKSNDPDRKAAAEKKLEELKKQAEQQANNQPGGSGNNGEQKIDRKELEQAAQDLASNDSKRQQQGRDKLDKMMGQENRKQAEQLLNDLKSNDPKRQQAAREKLDELRKQAEQQANNQPNKGSNGQGAGNEQKPDRKEVEKAMQDLASNDPKRQQQGRDKLDKMAGPENRKQAEQLLNDLKSDDPNRQKAAREKLEELKKQAEQQANNQPNKEPGGSGAGQKLDRKELEQAAQDLASNDPKRQQAARDKLDKMVGPENRKQAEQLANDLKSDDPNRQKAAREKLEELKKQAERMANENGSKQEPKGKNAGEEQKVDPKAVEKALNDLNSQDPKTRQAAKDQLDKMMGKGAGEKAEEMNKGLNSDKFEDQAKARKQRDDLLKKAEQMAKEGAQPPRGKELSQQDKEELAKKAGDLNSPDDAKRKAAEEEFDKKIGKQNREKLQEAMKDQKDNTQQQAEDLKKQLDQMTKNDGTGDADPTGNNTPKGVGSATTPLNPAMKDDPKNRAKSAELQLDQFEKNRYNKNLQERLGWTQEQYDEFLKSFRGEVDQLKKEAERAEATAPLPPPTVNLGGNSGKVESRPNSAAGTGGVTGPAFAPPGFADAMMRFQKGATTLGTKKAP